RRPPSLHHALAISHRRIACLYRVLDSRPEAVPCAALAFPSLRRFLTRRTCLLAPGKNSAAPKRTFSSALVSAGWRAQRENERRKERGILAGRSKKNCGPHLTAVLLTDGSQVCIEFGRAHV